MISIHRAETRNIPDIQSIAQATWPVTYEKILSKEQIEYMLDWMYSTPSLIAQMEHNNVFLLASENGVYLGFCSYELHFTKTDVTKLHKIYLLQESKGKGVGKALIEEVEKRAKSAGNNSIQLNVNRYNSALDFYKKLGFNTILREEDIDIGHNFFMNDYVLEKKVN